MPRLVFVGSHLGYEMDKTPLGGGAMVGFQLARHWPRGGDPEIVYLGSGPAAPAPGARYVRLPGDREGARALESLSELEYARFCRRFERAATEWLLSRRAQFEPETTAVLVNDISEGPSLDRLEKAGFPVASIWHVDVVDYFNRLYMSHMIPVESLAGLYERVRPLRAAIPDLLHLIFEKQRETVLRSRRMIFPSTMMARTVERCYGGLLPPGEFARRSAVIPWGVWESGVDEARAAARAARLRDHFQIGPDSLVLMTLSRISPEKGLHILLEALRRLERGPWPYKDLVLFVCGEPAFMQGQAYGRRVRAEAEGLRRARVFLPGYLDEEGKRAYLGLAHLFVSPSVHESYGLNIVEAMRAGVAVLASEQYGVQDLLREDYGRVVPYRGASRAPSDMAQALRELLAEPGRLRAMGRRAAEAARAMPFAAAAEKVLETCLAMTRTGAAA